MSYLEIEIARRGCTRFYTHIQPGILSLSREFYTNATEGVDRLVIVRGVLVSYSRETICTVLETLIVEKDKYGQFASSDTDYLAIAESLHSDPSKWVMTSDRSVFGINCFE
ncbi:hypothetical protein ACH5RR_037288 [Cinchona calisaya]|uniref:Putative plant transposon protein domain-containing protein n=1 Tax=Cinchona calisaya TaxID=153742 RepID=A0ABD2Y9D6_9GENT